MALFSFVAAYNSHTTQDPIICQIRKKAHLISAGPAEAYGDVKIRTTVVLNGFAVGLFVDWWVTAFSKTVFRLRALDLYCLNIARRCAEHLF